MYDRLYQLSDRYHKYTQDTKIALNEVVSQTIQVAGDSWATATGFSHDTSIKDLPTRALEISAKLSASSTAPHGCLPRLSKLALDRAIRGRL
jgi:hypothetical protein